MWAERRTSLLDATDGRSLVEAVALWVHLDPDARRPTPLTEEEIAVYGPTGSDRRVSARLRHPAAPDPESGSSTWRFRATDCDLADHVNNAAYLEPLEEELLAGLEPRRIDVEIEFRGPAQPGEKQVFANGCRRWIMGTGEAHASLLVRALELGELG
jgi:acyl-ACP thioesterase